MQFLSDNFDLMWRAFLTTLSLAVTSGICALVLGTVLVGMRVSPVTPLRGLATFYVEVFRNTPLTVVFFFLFFGVVYIDVQFPSRFVTAVTALSLYTAAFVAEALRSGINSVPPGQAEAARALGLDFGQTLRSIVLPQAFRTVVPPLGNVWIALAKNTSIAAGFAVTDLTAALQRLANANADKLLAVFAAIVAAYLLITLPSAWLIRVVENRVAIVR
ncbi:amino acid ABC transporter permease [Geodermatophilus sabuli]|uniref:Amino acid ABC transporter membrane protein 1, PAAT family n=1 Tax=Geodermatophilus sabuli TaxID=1564158 RepID=A0A285EFQ4_9ACTN|nr:amino acid ABC transporter permease [Geodermatophilus sabuli]MBB3086462.1 glutamate transport system permease protein [Geodermatophilus sabuli]SNX97885.1 amino acid ABC transporter membrane protein 1, PAAT family [Geodermatophilus sabuli]